MRRTTCGETTVTYDPDQGQLTVSDDTTTVCSGTIDVRLAVEHASQVAAVDTIETTVDVAQAPIGGAVDVTLTVENTGDRPVRLAGFDLLDGQTAFGPDARLFVHGYQSWSPTATLDVTEQFPPVSDRERPQMVDLAAPRDALSSHGVTAFTGPTGTVTLGFLDHETYLSRFDVRSTSGGDTTLAARCPADGVELAAGELRKSATLRIDATRSIPDALAALGDAIGDRMDARCPTRAGRGSPESLADGAAPGVPTGWCSWYHYFTAVTADDVRANVDAIDSWGVPLDIVQLDDGYEQAFGDWRSLADGFTAMDDLCADVVDAAHTPGLWVAPFYVQADSELAATHPDWLLTRDGTPVDAGPRHGPMYALDTTHPGVQAWLRDLFTTITDEWGFEYLKLDFLYAAALPGDRVGDVTRAEAYRTGLRVVREAVGDTFVLGCGAPCLPSVGLVDAMRVGPDTAPFWRKPEESASQPAHENAVRNVLNRQPWHRRLWLNDPDCQLLRTTTELTAAEREAFAALVAFGGGSNFLSDRVAEIDPAGRRLFERTLPPVEGGRVEGIGTREFPDRIVCSRPADGGGAVAAFNWDDEPTSLRVTPDDIGVDDDTTDTTDTTAWVALESDRDRSDGTVRDGARLLHRTPVEREVPPHGVLVVHYAPAADHPHLVGARQLAGAASQVTQTQWHDGQLRIDLAADEPMDLVVACPHPWRPVDGAIGTTAPSDPSRPAHCIVTATPGANTVAFATD